MRRTGDVEGRIEPARIAPPRALRPTRGLAKNTAHVVTLFALSNLWMARRQLMAMAVDADRKLTHLQR